MSRNIFIRLDDYFRWRLKLHYDVGPFAHLEEQMFDGYMLVGGHPARIFASVGMRGGIVWTKGFSIIIETYARAYSGKKRLEYGLIADVHAVSRLDLGGDSFLHPNYEIGRPGGCEICVMGWAKFTPYADAADVHRLLQLELSCLTRWRPCETQSDIMPVVWKQYLREGLQHEVACSASIIQNIGRDSAYVIVGEVLRYSEKANKNPDLGYTGNARLRVLQVLKGPGPVSMGDIRDVPVYIAVPGEVHLRPGARLVLFARYRNETSVVDLRYDPCAPILASNANLRLIRSGIDQDYSAADEQRLGHRATDGKG